MNLQQYMAPSGKTIDTSDGFIPVNDFPQTETLFSRIGFEIRDEIEGVPNPQNRYIRLNKTEEENTGQIFYISPNYTLELEDIKISKIEYNKNVNLNLWYII